MAAMLGEMLMKAGALTRDQLEQVLGAQAIYGGRLGTNLVEMGLIGEEELSRLLKEKTGIPPVDPSLLDSIPVGALAAVPLEIVQRYRVLPVALEGKRLTLAMVDPDDFKAIEEIGFVTGLVVVPRSCCELRLAILLERHYGIERPLRYIPVSGGPRTRFAPSGYRGPGAPAVQEAGDEVREEAGPLAAAIGMEELTGRLAAALREAQVVSALLSYLGGAYDRAAFLSLKPGTVLGVKAVAAGEEIAGFAGLVIALEESQQLRGAVRERDLFLGEFALPGAAGDLVHAGAPAPSLVVPVTVAGQVAALIWVSDSKGRLAGGVFELRRVAALAELAFEMLRIRKRISSG